jgi:hypothetical protein
MANNRKDHDAPHTASHPGPHGQLSRPGHGPTAAEAENEDAGNDESPASLAGGRVKSTPPPSPSPARAPLPPPGSPDDERVEYRPNRKLHICEAGPVALSNWVGRVGSKFVRVYRGAQGSTLPGPVTAAMKESGVDVGLVTYEELGLRQPPATMLLRR